MSTAFDASAIERHGWRQGAVLGASLADEARKLAPSGIVFAESDWLVVTSHDCDVVNGRLEKEPTVEVLRASVVQQKKPELESLVETFWKQFAPGIECVGVEVIATSALTLADIEKYQRFDADWVSFADDSPATPSVADMRA